MTDLPEPSDIIRQVVADSNRLQAWWAGQLGYSLRHFNQLYNGRGRVSVEFAVRFAALSGVPARSLLRMQADLDLRVYLRVEAETNGRTGKPSRVVEGPNELAGPALDRATRQYDGRLVRNARPTRYTGGR